MSDLSPEAPAALEDTLDLVSDPQAVREIRKARDEFRGGESVGADELRAKYLQRDVYRTT